MNSHDAVKLLNELLVSDQPAIETLCETRVPCSQELERHLTVQAMNIDGVGMVGMLGILNGIFGCGPDNRGYIVGHYTDDGKTLLHFESTEPR